jgi:hypothetical protein
MAEGGLLVNSSRSQTFEAFIQQEKRKNSKMLIIEEPFKEFQCHGNEIFRKL